MNTAFAPDVSILSIQTPSLGHGTYARLMQDYFAQSGCCLDSLNLLQDRETLSRVVWKLLTQQLPGQWAAEHNIDMRRFRHELGIGYIGRRLAVRNLCRKPYQVLHFHTQVPALLSADLMRRVPTVITGDATAALISGQPGIPGRRWTHAPSLSADKRVFRAAAKVAMWSEWAAQSVVCDYGTDPANVSVIYPGVDLKRLSPPPRRKTTSALPVQILFVGGDFERKGGHDLLDVFLQGFSDVAELHLMTGADVGCTHPRVHVYRGVEAYSEEWLSLYRTADIFVLPTHSEAFGLVYTEAMAMGLPVIGTRINAIPEIVDHGETGLLVPPGNRHELAAAIQSMIGNPAKRLEAGAAGRNAAERKFDAKKNFRALEGVFRQAAVGASQSPSAGRKLIES